MADYFGGGALASLFGKDAAPRAVLNRFAAPTAKPLGQYGGTLLGDIEPLQQQAVTDYLGMQPKFQGLAGQQEGVLNTLLGRRLNADPNQLLQNIGQTAFGFIDPNVVSPLAKFDVNYDTLSRRARGLNPAAVDSTAERLRNARIASGRYYDTAKQAYSALPQLYNEAFGQGLSNDAAAAGLVPQIAAGYESVASRPWNAINQRIASAGGASDAASKAIQGVLAATQGYKTPKNWADRIGAASQNLSGSVGDLAGLYGSLGGGGGGGGGL
jgi:hypothetical protein